MSKKYQYEFWFKEECEFFYKGESMWDEFNIEAVVEDLIRERSNYHGWEEFDFNDSFPIWVRNSKGLVTKAEVELAHSVDIIVYGEE